MSINITNPFEVNVVNVGDEITSDQLASIQNASSPSAANPLATINDIGGNPFNQSLNTTNNVEFLSVEAGDFLNNSYTLVDFLGVQGYDNGTPTFVLNYSGLWLGGPNTGISFNDGTRQTTAALTPDLTSYAEKAASNTFTEPQNITVASGSVSPLTINNNGTGPSFVVNDSIPDTTPFVISAGGLVGIGVTSPTYVLDVAGSARIANTAPLFASLYVSQGATAATAACFVVENRGTGDCVYVHDQTAPDTTPFVINNAGNVVIGATTVTANHKLDVIGNIRASGLTFISSGFRLENVSYSPGTALGTVTPDYPNELTITVDGVSYRIPARTI